MVVTSEEEKMEKSVEWSKARGVGMVEAEERAGPGEKRTERKKKIRNLSMVELGAERGLPMGSRPARATQT